MTMKAKLAAASAIAAGLAVGGAAEALAPLRADLAHNIDREPGDASSYAQAAPAEFVDETASEPEFTPSPSLNRRGPRLQCVPFARDASGVEIYGNANTWWQQAAGRFERTHAPADGAVIVMRGYAGAARGHVAVVRQVISDRVVLIDHANWLNGGEITRSVPVRDVSPRGDWSQVQVWHVPGAHWGGRTYSVQGFILPGALEPDAATVQQAGLAVGQEG